MFRQSLIAILLIACAGPASAQDATWWKTYNEAKDNNNTNEALSTLKTLEENSSTVLEKSIAGYGMGLVSAESGQFGQAALHWERAHKNYMSQNEKNDRLYNGISLGLIQVYIKSNRDKDAERMSIERNEILSPKNDDIWSTSNDQPTHRFTGLTCPFSIGEFVRQEYKNLSPLGVDLSCHYKTFSEEFNVLTLYFTKYEDGVSEKNAHKWTLELMEPTFEGAGADYLDKKVKIEDASLPVRLTESTYSYETQEGNVLSGAWTGVFGDWVFKTRVSWSARLGSNFGRAASINLLRSTTPQIVEHLKKCDGIEDFEYEQFSSVSEEDKMAAVLGALVANELSGALSEENAGLDLSAPRPSRECMRHYYSKDGSVFISQHYDGRRIYSIDGRNIASDVYFAPEAGFSANGYILEGREPDGTTIVYKKYAKVPRPKDLLADYIEFHDGRASPLGSITVDDDGNSQVNISVPKE